MVVHKCTKEEEIDSIKEKLNNINNKMDMIYSKLMGNGQPGLIQKWYELEGSFNTLKIIVGLVGLIISAIALIK